MYFCYFYRPSLYHFNILSFNEVQVMLENVVICLIVKPLNSLSIIKTPRDCLSEGCSTGFFLNKVAFNYASDK